MPIAADSAEERRNHHPATSAPARRTAWRRAGPARKGIRHLESVLLEPLLRTARAVALGLLSLGLKPGDRVAIAGENTPEWFYADLGIQMIGAVAVGIYPTNPWVELQYIVRHSGARVVVTAIRNKPTRYWTRSPTMTACRRSKPSSAST